MTTPDEHSSDSPDQVNGNGVGLSRCVLMVSVLAFAGAVAGSWSISKVFSSNKAELKATEDPCDSGLQDLQGQIDRLNVLLERRLQQLNPDGRGTQP